MVKQLMSKEELLVWMEEEIILLENVSDLSDHDKGWYNALTEIRSIYYGID